MTEGADFSDDGLVHFLRNLTVVDFKNMVFNSEGEGETFYREYATIMGFVVRKHDQRRRRNGVLVMCKWVCSRQGVCRTLMTEGTSRGKRSFRSDCQASFRINLGDDERWSVAAVHLQHNHEMVRNSKSCFMTSNRGLSRGDIVGVQTMLQTGFRQCDIMRYLSHVSGGIHRVGFTKRDLYNNVVATRTQSATVDAYDVVFSYLTGKKNGDCRMALVTDVDNGVLSWCYWADSKCRMDYHYFGDVLAMDSTFKTNSYDLSLVVLVGVNHYHQTILFGCALLNHETTESYRWLFRTHALVMAGKQPMSIVTDGDKAMQAALVAEWPTVHHRLCMWHFQRNLSNNIGNPALLKDIQEFMYSKESPSHLEESWETIVDRYCLKENKWMQELYEWRAMLWDTYLRGHFWAEMRSTQRCERMHGFMKGYLRRDHKLHEFLHHFDRALADLRHKEVEAEYMSTHRRERPLTMLKKLEEHAADIFTTASLKRVRDEMKKETLYSVVSSRIGNVEQEYILREYDRPGKTLTVYSTIGRPEITCSCLHYETYGFPCAHAFHIAKAEFLTRIPENLIRSRWTKSAKIGETSTMDACYGVSIEQFRQGWLSAACERMCYWGSRSTNAFQSLSDSIVHLTDTMGVLNCTEDYGVPRNLNKNGNNCRKRKKKVNIFASKPMWEVDEMRLPDKSVEEAKGNILCSEGTDVYKKSGRNCGKDGQPSILGRIIE